MTTPAGKLQDSAHQHVRNAGRPWHAAEGDNPHPRLLIYKSLWVTLKGMA
jgi:hypothetical protein